MEPEEIKTHFRGPGEWASQARELEDEAEEVVSDEDPE